MKKILSVVLAIVLLLAVIFCGAFVKQLDYTARPDKTTLNAILTGIPADKTSINKNTSGRDYYAVLNSYEYESLSFAQTLRFLTESTDAASTIFTSSTAKSAAGYDAVFLIGYIVITDDEQLYLYIAYGGENAGATVYRAKGDVELSAFDENDFEESQIVPNLLHDTGTTIILFCRNHAFVIVVFAAVALFCLFFFTRLVKRRKQESDLAFGKETKDELPRKK